MKNLSPETKKWLLPLGFAAFLGTLITVFVVCVATISNAFAASLQTQRASVAESGAPAEKRKSGLPTAAEASALAAEALLHLDSAIKTGDFAALHGNLSKFWQKQITPAELKTTLEPLVKEGTDFAGLEDLEAVFDKAPRINDNGLLEVGGFFPSHPRRVIFEFSFIRERSGWELFSFFVKTGSNPLALPGGEDREKLVEETLLDFNAALQAKDFSEFHADLSVPFQKQLSAADFLGAFQSLIDAKIDLSDIKGLCPVIPGEAALNEDGMLEVVGNYTTAGQRVKFELMFTPEPPDWKLLGIWVHVSPLESPKEGNGGKITDSKVIETNPIEDLVQFLEENVALASDADRSEFSKRLRTLLERKKSFADGRNQ